MEDRELVARILEGERDLFRTLVERHQSRIYYLGRKFFHHPEEAEDFVQEVFLRCFRKLDAYSGKAPFSAWLYRLAYNAALNTKRFKERIREDFFPIIEGADEAEETPEQCCIAREAKAELNRAVASLSGLQTMLIRLHYYEGHEYRRIAEITGMPVGTIKSHMHRTKKTLKAMLQQNEGDRDEQR